MANSLIILQKLVMLFGFIFIGYFAFKKEWLTREGTAQISKLVVLIFNPALMLSTAVCSTERPPANMVISNAILVCVFFGSLLAVSPLCSKLLRIPAKDKDIFPIINSFGNTAFMGIPLVSSLYGDNSTIFVAFYAVGFNLLFYTYALHIYRQDSGEETKFSISDLINAGTVACVLTVIAFLIPIDYPAVVTDCLSSIAGVCVPAAMMVTGCALAQVDLKQIFTDLRLYAFTILRMIIIPIIVIMINKYLLAGLINPVLAGILAIMYAMPNGSLPVIACEEYGIDADFPSRAFALTTLLALVTVPIVTALL